MHLPCPTDPFSDDWSPSEVPQKGHSVLELDTVTATMKFVHPSLVCDLYHGALHQTCFVTFLLTK